MQIRVNERMDYLMLTILPEVCPNDADFARLHGIILDGLGPREDLEFTEAALSWLGGLVSHLYSPVTRLAGIPKQL